jgi:AraC-like DNA-binding protein
MEQSKCVIKKTAFISQLEQGLEAHLSDPGFSVQKMQHLAHMSRASLHRKVKKETGMSASAYKRHLRLAKAMDLLQKQPDWSVYQVALEVGFCSLSYFTKKFKEQFGCSPKVARSRNLQHTVKLSQHWCKPVSAFRGNIAQVTTPEKTTAL